MPMQLLSMEIDYSGQGLSPLQSLMHTRHRGSLYLIVPEAYQWDMQQITTTTIIIIISNTATILEDVTD